MPNHYFQFKEFLINQDKSSMKVTTDGCLFGAIIDHEEAKQILDIGAGTGLLSLMMSQKISDAKVTAVEIDSSCAIECAANFEASRWKDRLKIINVSIQEFAENSDQKFDLIVSNPPFYQNHFLPQNNNQSIARHQETWPGGVNVLRKVFGIILLSIAIKLFKNHWFIS